jgi:hypothetical protein
VDFAEVFSLEGDHLKSILRAFQHTALPQTLIDRAKQLVFLQSRKRLSVVLRKAMAKADDDSGLRIPAVKVAMADVKLSADNAMQYRAMHPVTAFEVMSRCSSINAWGVSKCNPGGYTHSHTCTMFIIGIAIYPLIPIKYRPLFSLQIYGDLGWRACHLHVQAPL